MPESVIEVVNLAKFFTSSGGKPILVLDHVNLNVHAGETLVIMGGSGCGKSTLLNCLIGEYRPDDGQIKIFGKDIARMDEFELNEVRKKFGILFQSGALFNSMTVEENVALPLLEHSDVDPLVINIIVTIKLEQVKMLPHRDKMPSQLSGGQKKRAGLARAIALDPQILFYDEPSAGLDPVTVAAIDDLIISLSKKLGVTSVVVTHDMQSAFRIADRMVMLHAGRVLRIGSREEFYKLSQTPMENLSDPNDRLIKQFILGEGKGPLTDSEGLSEYEKMMSGVET
ncbi:MAG: ATP-binding cassette domain-containing protein [Phycisphaerae bacterium]